VIGEMPTMAARAGCQDVVDGNHPFSCSTIVTDAGVRVLGPTAVEAARGEHGGSAIADREGVVAERLGGRGRCGCRVQTFFLVY
jgi:hypothetical protein